MKIRKIVRDERGGAMVEFALVAPILFVLVLGIIEFGRAWHTYQVITDAAREGARRAVVRDGADKVGTDSTFGSVPEVVLDRFTRSGIETQGAWDLSNYTADCDGWNAPSGTITAPELSGCGWGRDTGEEARVVIRAPYPFAFLQPVLRLIGGNIDGRVLETNYIMRNE